MRVELIVALIAGAVALASAAGTIWSSMRNAERSNGNAKAIEQIRIANEQARSAAQRRQEISRFSEPLARAAYDLQSRFYNILNQGLMSVYLVQGNIREKSYIIENTTFLIAQYLCWTELARREIQFIDLGEASKTRALLRLQDRIYSLWGTDAQPAVLRIFAGEQRAIGEALIQTTARGPECMGYGLFLKTFAKGVDPVIDAVRDDVMSLDTRLAQAISRLTNLQHALIELLDLLDPDSLRFPKDRRSKA